MAKLAKEKIKVGDRDDYIEVTIDINVSAAGDFTTTLSTNDAEMIESYGVSLHSNGRSNGRKGFFTSNTKIGLVEEVKEVLRLCVVRTVLSEEIILRYVFHSTCSFAKTLEGNIIPGPRWGFDGKVDDDLFWVNGTQMTHEASPAPCGLMMYIAPFKKVVFGYGNNTQKTKYIKVNREDVKEDKSNYYLQWLANICSHDKPRGQVREIPYDEQRAKFFVDMYKSLARLSNTIANFEDPEMLLELMDRGGNLLER